LLIIGTLCVDCFAQDIKADLQEMQNRYQNAQNFYTQISISAISLNSADKSSYKQKTEIWKQGENYAYTVDDKMMLINAESVIMLDSKNKILIYQSRPKDKSQLPNQTLIPQVDSLLKQYKKIEYKGNTNGCRKYHITTDKSAVYKADLYINTSTYFLDKMVYWYEEPIAEQHNQITMEFKNTTLQPVIEAGFFSEKKYIIKTGKDIKLQPSMKDYQLMVIPKE